MSLSRYAPVAGLLGLLALSACGGGSTDNPNVRPVAENEYNDYRTKGERGKLAGDAGLVFGIGKGTGSAANQDGAALGVNAYLWRGALDTLAFMPLASADPFGGVIITDWYQPPSSSGERFKATAYILGRQLRADGVRVAIFRQVLAERPVGGCRGEPDDHRRDREQGAGASP